VLTATADDRSKAPTTRLFRSIIIGVGQIDPGWPRESERNFDLDDGACGRGI